MKGLRTEAEREVLAVILRDNSKYFDSGIRANDFEAYQDEAKKVFDELEAGKKLNHAEAANTFNNPFYRELIRSTKSQHFESNCQYLISTSKQKKVESLCMECMDKLVEEDADSVIEYFIKMSADLSDRSAGGFKFIADYQTSVANKIAKAMKGEMTGVPSGFHGLDNLTYGFQPNDYVVIGARPGMGKTAMALQMAVAAAKKENDVLFFSLEMAPELLIERWIAQEKTIEASRIKRGKLTQDEMRLIDEFFNSKYAKKSIAIEQSRSITEIRRKCRKKKKTGLDLVIIDYIQLIRSKARGNRNEIMTDISQNIMEMAAELQIPVIALAQLSRDVEKRGGSRIPNIADIRESGSIEQDASMIMFPYRPEYYDLPITDDQGNYTGGIYLEKHRNGETGFIPQVFQPMFVRFTNPDTLNNIKKLLPNDGYTPF